MPFRSLRHVLLALATTLAVGCAPSLKVNVLQPARVNLGASQRLSIVQTEGRRGARDFLIEELLRQGRAGAYFQVADRSEEGIVVKPAGRSVQVLSSGTGAPQAPDEVGLRMDVLDWDADQKSRMVEEKDKEGNVVEREVQYYEAKVAVSITLFNMEGKAALSEQEYEAVVENAKKDGALEDAARTVVYRLLTDITPRYVTKYIRLDDEDEAQKPIIEVARNGNVPRAITEMEAYTQANPQSAAALYNLAVMLDATGRYEEALDLYTRAITLSSKDFYVSMKSECARRLADQQALSQ
jgi:tetratricopeptide (TPR) repeat protein